MVFAVVPWVDAQMKVLYGWGGLDLQINTLPAVLWVHGVHGPPHCQNSQVYLIISEGVAASLLYDVVPNRVSQYLDLRIASSELPVHTQVQVPARLW